MVVKGKMLRLTQAIQVPEKMSASFFELDCIVSAIKYCGNVYYIVRAQNQTRQIAEPGDWICQHLDGTWEVLNKEKYQKFFAK